MSQFMKNLINFNISSTLRLKLLSVHNSPSQPNFQFPVLFSSVGSEIC